MADEKEKTITKSGRLREIMAVMRRHHFLSNFYRQKNPHEIRLTLQELGPTFIKLGQILSTRSDLVSPAYIAELRHLQDQVQSDPFASVKATFKAETGKELGDVFAAFDAKPFASASIGQVHHAKLKDGTPVVVKVQHPAVTQLVDTDLSLMRRAVKLLKYVPNDVTVVDFEKVLDELSRSLLSEVDTLQEAKNGEMFYRLNNQDDIILVPKVYPKLCAPRILVNQTMAGRSVRYLFDQPLSHDKEEAARQTKQRKYIAQVLVKNFLKQVFVDHFFHADPHPGNILIDEPAAEGPQQAELQTTKQVQKQAGNIAVSYRQQRQLPPYRIIYLDFGMMGSLTPTMADGIAKVVLAITTKNIRRIGEAILAICNQTGPLDENQFFKELGRFLHPYLSEGLGEIDFANMLYQVIQLCQRNHLQIKPEVTMLVKAFGTLESTVAKLDPDISMMAVARPFAKKYLRRKFNWRDSLDDGLINLFLAGKAVTDLPEKLGTALDTVADGDVEVKLKYRDQERLLKQVERVANRFLIVIILAAVILGSSILVEGSSRHPGIYHLGVAGYTIALVVIIVLVVNETIHRWRNWRNDNK